MAAFHTLFAHSALFWSALPLVLPQALSLRKRAPRWPAAAGPRSGRLGDGLAPLRLLAVGDSPFEGAAIDRIEDTLPVRLAARLHEAWDRPVAWCISARSGATARAVRAMGWPRDLMPVFDLALVSVGVNDVTGLTRRKAFGEALSGLLRDLREASPEAVVVLLGVPPMHAFPLLPQPLRAWVGGRSRALDRVGRACALRSGVMHLPLELDPAPEMFAQDGFHPSPRGNEAWAHQVWRALQSRGVSASSSTHAGTDRPPTASNPARCDAPL